MNRVDTEIMSIKRIWPQPNLNGAQKNPWTNLNIIQGFEQLLFTSGFACIDSGITKKDIRDYQWRINDE